MVCVKEREENEYMVRPCVPLGPHCPANLEQTSWCQIFGFHGPVQFPTPGFGNLRRVNLFCHVRAFFKIQHCSLPLPLFFIVVKIHITSKMDQFSPVSSV